MNSGMKDCAVIKKKQGNRHIGNLYQSGIFHVDSRFDPGGTDFMEDGHLDLR